MNTKLIFQLSLFGLAMGFATLSLIPSNIEPFFWLGIFLVCAYLIAKNCTEKYFLTGLYVSLLNAAWMTAIQILFADTYIANHLRESEMMPITDSPRLMMLLTGPVIGVISGVVLGLFALIASKLVKKKAE